MIVSITEHKLVACLALAETRESVSEKRRKRGRPDPVRSRGADRDLVPNVRGVLGNLELALQLVAGALVGRTESLVRGVANTGANDR